MFGLRIARSAAATFVVCAALLCLSTESAHALPDSGAERRAALLRSLGDEAAAVRERALAALEADDEITESELRETLESAPPRARPLLLRVAGLRRFAGLAALVAAHAAAGDQVAAEAATRALVSIGPEGVAEGEKALADPSLAPRLRRLRALDAQRRVEHEVVSRWRRKGGSYRGRYTALGEMGYAAQPVLLAMLLDVPLEDAWIHPPKTGDPDRDQAARGLAVWSLARCTRRGYRTFDPLPSSIEREDLFALASQALADAADLSVVGDVLLAVHGALVSADDAATFRGRPFEKLMAEDIEVLLAARGNPSLLEVRLAKVRGEVAPLERVLRGSDVSERPEEFNYVAVKKSEQASILHQLMRYDDAERVYRDVIRIRKEIGGMERSEDGYNRACALARGGRRKEALDQIERALDPKISTGFEDLTPEWIREDGDLESIREDPRFEGAIRRRFQK